MATQLGAIFELKSNRNWTRRGGGGQDFLSECTEKCVKLIGEVLDVDYTFTVEITVSDESWDITVRRADMQEGLQTTKNELCDQCGLQRARQLLGEMFLALRPGGKLAGSGEGILALVSSPSAKVFLNGIPSGSTPIELTVKTGRDAEVLLVAEGYDDYSKVYTLTSGAKIKEDIRLVQKRGAVQLQTTTSGAAILVDGEAQTDASGNPLTTPTTLRLSFGQRVLLFKLSVSGHTQGTLVNQRDMNPAGHAPAPARPPGDHRFVRTPQRRDLSQ